MALLTLRIKNKIFRILKKLNFSAIHFHNFVHILFSPVDLIKTLSLAFLR